MSEKGGLTYAQSGVDIDAGNRMVELIKPLVKATARPGADAEIGGFGGLFDLKARGLSRTRCWWRPTTASAPRSRSRSRPACTTPSASISSPCRSTIWSCRAPSRCSSSTTSPPASSIPKVGAAGGQGHRRRLPQAGCALIGGETAEMPGVYHGDDYDLAGFAVGAVERGAILPRDDIAAGDVVLGIASSGVHSNGYSLVRKVVARSRLELERAGAVRQRAKARRRGADADPHLRQILPRRDPRDQGREGARPHHRRRLSRQHSARAAEGPRRRASIWRASRCCRCSNGWPRPAASPRRKCCAPSTAASA